MSGLSDDVYRSVWKWHSVDERCIQTWCKIEYGYTVRFTTAEDIPYRQSLCFSLKLEQTQRVCTRRRLVAGGAGSSSSVLYINEEFNVSFNPNQLCFIFSWISKRSDCPITDRWNSVGYPKGYVWPSRVIPPSTGETSVSTTLTSDLILSCMYVRWVGW